MSGNAHQRRKARRAKEREARKKMDEEASKLEELETVRRKFNDFVSQWDDDPPHEVEIQPPTPIVQPEPSGEAEKWYTPELKKLKEELIEAIEEYHPPKKKRGIWNWLRKLVGR